MKKIQKHFIFTTLFLFISSNLLYAQKWDKCRGKDIPGENIYKHYSGTLGNKKIVLDLRFGFCGGSNYGGSTYYYPGKEGTTLFYIGEPDSFDYKITLYGKEQPKNDKLLYDPMERIDRNKLSKWTFKIIGNKLIGNWSSADGKEKYDINLTEDYSSSYPMDLTSFNDTISKIWLLYSKPSSKTNKADADFITAEQINFLSGSKNNTHNWSDYLKTLNGQNTFEYAFFLPVYNEKGIIAFESNSTTKNSGLYRSGYTFLCLDVINKRKLMLNDILSVDSVKLSQLLEAAFRKNYILDKEKKLNTWLQFDRIPVTGNIVLAESGINFCYGFNEIIIKKDNSYPAEDPIKIFLSYQQLKQMLKPDFKKRIGL